MKVGGFFGWSWPPGWAERCSLQGFSTCCLLPSVQLLQRKVLPDMVFVCCGTWCIQGRRRSAWRRKEAKVCVVQRCWPTLPAARKCVPCYRIGLCTGDLRVVLPPKQGCMLLLTCVCCPSPGMLWPHDGILIALYQVERQELFFLLLQKGLWLSV